MTRALQVLKLTAVCALLAVPAIANAQTPQQAAAERERLARRGGGLRAGIWNVDVAPGDQATPHFEGYFQRGLDRQLALENSLGVWRLTTTTPSTVPEGTPVETKTWILPLLTSLKLYPLTNIDDRLEPWLMAGVGFAFGLSEQSENAIGGGGSTIVTGIGLRGGAGMDMRLIGPIGISVSGKYQWIHFGEELDGSDTFNGVGVEGGITYRFRF